MSSPRALHAAGRSDSESGAASTFHSGKEDKGGQRTPRADKQRYGPTDPPQSEEQQGEQLVTLQQGLPVDCGSMSIAFFPNIFSY